MSAFLQNYKEAVESPECEYWKNAMNEQMNSPKENTFTLTTLPEGRKLVGVAGCTLSKKAPMDPKHIKLDMLRRSIVRCR